MSWGRLDDRLWSHPKIVAAGNEVVGSYLRCVSFCCAHRSTNGRIPRATALYIASAKVLAKAVAGGLLEVDGDSWRVHDFEEWNGTSQRPSTPAELSAKRSDAGRKGAAKRWHQDSNVANGKRMPSATRQGIDGSDSSSPLRSRDQEITAASETRSPRADAREPPNRHRSDPPTQAASESFNSTPGESESGTRLVAPVVKAPRALAPPEPLPADLEARRQAQLRELDARRAEFEPAAGGKP